jgi:hypothetical protein
MEFCDFENNGNEYGFGFGQMFFMGLGLLPFVTLIPCIIVAKFVHDPLIRHFNKLFGEVKDILTVPTPYEERYEIKDASANNLTKLNNIVVGYTPDGSVAMRYNKKDEIFEYWADTKSVSYKYLETVARKYANSFGCGCIYIDRMKLLKEKVDKIKKQVEENIKREEEEKKKREENSDSKDNEETSKDDSGDVFANLKKYNTSTDEKKKDKTKKTITKNDRVCDKANRYIRKGKFNDHKDWLFLPEPKKDSIGGVNVGIMSWLDWKNSKSD